MTSAASTARIRKLLALSASAALIGSAHEAEAALNRAMIIAQDNRIEIAPLAAAAGVELPRPKPAPLADRSHAGDTGRGYTLTRTLAAGWSRRAPLGRWTGRHPPRWLEERGCAVVPHGDGAWLAVREDSR